MLSAMPSAPAPEPIDDALEPTPGTSRSGFVLAVLVLLASTLLVVLAWRAARERELKAAHTNSRPRARRSSSWCSSAW
jgi:hypothetical protein